MIEEQFNLVNPSNIVKSTSPKPTVNTGQNGTNPLSTQSPVLSSDDPAVQKEIEQLGNDQEKIKARLAQELDLKLQKLMQQRKQLGLE
jgi:hypothetical protein